MFQGYKKYTDFANENLIQKVWPIYLHHYLSFKQKVWIFFFVWASVKALSGI